DFRDSVRHPQGLSSVSRQPLRMLDAVSGETLGNYKPQDHGQQPGNILQDHHSNSGRESLS
ncbi:hypothetical protein L9F63_013558, partial [Diploptera punctata]